MATAQISHFITSTSFSDLPTSVVKATVRSFQNSLGCILGGASHPTTQRALRALPHLASTSTLIGNAQLSNVSTAALINGIASHVHDYDDTHLHTVIHPTGAVLVALLAYIEHQSAKVSGEAFITALAVGVEVGLRLGNAVSPNHYDEGWHITGTVSPIAAAAAISNLVLDEVPTRHAIGIASTQPVGIRVHFGTDTKALHVGRAAQNGIVACMLAREGFTAAEDAIEGRRGWVEVLGNGADGLAEQVGQMVALKGQWEIEKNTFKPFPCGIVIHPTIDACIQLHNELGLEDQTKVDEIESVLLRVHPLVLDLTGKRFPKNELEAKFSVYHGAAIGLVLGSATPEEYADEVVNDPRVVEIRDRVVAEVDPKLASDEVLVSVVRSGATVQKHIEHAVGSVHKPLSDQELRSKFLKSASSVLDAEQAEKLNDLAWNVLALEDVTQLLQMVRPTL